MIRELFLLLEVTAQNQEQTYSAVVDALFPLRSHSDNPPSCGAVVTRFRWDISAIPVNKPGIRNDRHIILFMARAVGGIAQPQPSEDRH